MRRRAVAMVAEVRGEYGTEFAAITAVAKRLGIGSAETHASRSASYARITSKKDNRPTCARMAMRVRSRWWTDHSA
jgi:hypothetical protein